MNAQEIFASTTPFSFAEGAEFINVLNSDTSSTNSMSSLSDFGAQPTQSGFPDDPNAYPDDWTREYMTLGDMSSAYRPPQQQAQQELQSKSSQDFSNTGLQPQAFSLDMYNNGAFSFDGSPLSSPAGMSSNSEENEQRYPNLPTPPSYAATLNTQSPPYSNNSSSTTSPQQGAGLIYTPATSNSGQSLGGKKLPKKTAGSKITKPRKEKTSHNMIEKRYRTNINDKIVALRSCVPTLRYRLNEGLDEKDLEGLTPASKLNKATVLTKATEYILHLQKKNKELEDQLAEMQGKLRSGVDDLLQPPPQGPPQPRDAYAADPPLAAQTQPAPQQFAAYPNMGSSEFKGRVLMASMAGMMGAGMYTNGVGGDMGGGNTRGLSMIPLFNLMGSNGVLATNLVKVALIVAAVGYALAPSLYRSRKPKKVATEAQSKMQSQIWEMTSKSMGIPQDRSVVHMVTAFFVTALQLIFHTIFGTRIISSGNDQTWSRAIDAQLCGGDIHAGKYNLALTLAKSLVLKPSARRYARLAVHMRVLSHEIRPFGGMLNGMAQSLWTKAAKDSDKSLSPHNKAMLSLCPEALSDPDTIQRLSNMVMNRPISLRISQSYSDEGIESVVKDEGIRSCVDAMAGWFASTLLHEVLIEVVEESEVNYAKIETAAAIAPPNSIVGRRVAVVQALLLGAKDGMYVKKAMELINSELLSDEMTSKDYLDGPIRAPSANVPRDVKLAMHCSFVLYYLSNGQTERAMSMLKSLNNCDLSDDIGLLGFVAIWITITQIEGASLSEDVCKSNLERMASCARLWIGSKPGERQGLTLNCRRNLVGECIKRSAMFGGVDDDEGYGST
ncbi:hypothetical protein TRVA0_008S00672 [Trichomonascus vanleenenianus]|uniref:uncharacterized protein n=1 Tax=Trichomonascus vanleenenianus TaxID=2268995 RepID=UPI003EC9DAA0